LEHCPGRQAYRHARSGQRLWSQGCIRRTRAAKPFV